MTPLLKHATGSIVHGDALEFLHLLGPSSVDHVIMDPPYSAKVHEAQRMGCTGYVEPTRPNAKKAQFNRTKELGFEPLDPALRLAICAQLRFVLRRWALVFCDLEGLAGWKQDAEMAGLEYVRGMCWRKKGAPPQFTGDRPGQGFEIIVLLHQKTAKGKNIKKRWNGGGKHGFYEYPIVLNRSGKTPRLHTTQKPLELMEALVSDFTDPGELILDPFAGSGTTLLAAQRLGRRWVGVEQDGKYAQVAATRLQEAANDNG